MRTSPRMSQEPANLVRRFWRQNMFELARLLLDFRLAIECQTVRKQSLGQSMSPNDIRRSLPSPRRELNNHAAIADRHSIRLQRVMAGIHKWLVIMFLR